MQKRRLGRSDLEISPMVLGGNVFGWTADVETSIGLLDRFVAAGFEAIDTADAYSNWVPGNRGGESETVIGEWLKRRKRRDDVLIFTKVGWDMGEGGKGLSRAHIQQSIEGSLRRLGTDYVDLYQSHRDDPEVEPEETLEAYGRLIAQGKVRAVGASNFTPERLKRSLDASASGLPRYESLQPPYNLYQRSDFEAGLQPLARSEEVGVISYYGLASGFLTGKYRSAADLAQSPRGQSVAKYMNPRGERILKALGEVALHLSATPAQVALAWLIARPGVTAPIVSATRTEQLDEILGAAQVGLDPESQARLDVASQPEPEATA
jgi:aryl-alcohol dehydrogenase-like predicted oxidoreductase